MNVAIPGLIVQIQPLAPSVPENIDGWQRDPGKAAAPVTNCSYILSLRRGAVFLIRREQHRPALEVRGGRTARCDLVDAMGRVEIRSGLFIALRPAAHRQRTLPRPGRCILFFRCAHARILNNETASSVPVTSLFHKKTRSNRVKQLYRSWLLLSYDRWLR